MRAAIIHVMADATVSVLVIVGLTLARLLGWLWMDALAGIVGALVTASWSAALIRDTSAVLLDMNPDRHMADNLRRAIEGEGDRIAVELDCAGVGAVRARQNLEQRRFSRAVLAEQRMDLGVTHFEMDVLQRQHAGEALADPGHLEDRAAGRRGSGRRRRRVGHWGRARWRGEK